MTPDQVLLQAIADDLTAALEGDRIIVKPKDRLSPELRDALLEQRAGVVQALRTRSSMAAIVAPIQPRTCTSCANLSGAYCIAYRPKKQEHNETVISEPERLCRCLRWKQREPVLPW